ncbi:hypothetical protein HT102_04645 [Hoyosella sp. G463]|uniref:Uncharacterized protein n=1 Tax=Lolliginicoccus lacisalsi TaxID=2742202 RepID=A0A927JBT1_9ACTN|nr:hypothetical protein [Lolliginicoccus lacisalsi]MBD8505772.1 hypothetical protein [Lolliginicoccus lacisalsi]
MTRPRPRRERVVLSARAGARPVRTRVELTESTAVGDVLVRGLMTTQRRLALRMAALVLACVLVLPAAFVLVPGLAGVTVGGVLLPWLLLAGAVYPLLLGVGWLYLRQAERNEQRFSELVDD